MTDLRGVSKEVLEQTTRDAARRVKDGEEARILRAECIAEAGRRNLPHGEVAEWAGTSRQAVSLQIAKSKAQERDTTE